MKRSTSIGWTALVLTPMVLLGVSAGMQPGERSGPETPDRARPSAKGSLRVQYLEIVTPAVAETCKALSEMHGVTFSEPIPELGNARTARLKDGGRIGVRAPMRETEQAVARPYLLVDDIKAAVKAAEAQGATFAVPPMEIPGQGTFAIYFLGGVQHGLWEQ